MRIKFILFLTALLVFSSCTIEKRRHTEGYHIQWNHQLAQRVTSTPSEKVEGEQVTKHSEETIVAKHTKANKPEENLASDKLVLSPNSHEKNLTKTEDELLAKPKIKAINQADVPDQLATKSIKNKKKLEDKNPPSWWERKTIFILEKPLRNSIALSILAALFIALVVTMFEILFLNMRGFILGAVLFFALITVATPIMTSIYGDPVDILPVLLKAYFTVFIVAIPSIIIGAFSIAYSNVRVE